MSDEGRNDLLGWLGLRHDLDFRKARGLGALFGVALIGLFALALATAVVLLFQTMTHGFTEDAARNLGAGALIVALLSAPFLVWNTVIKQQAVNFQKEGHMTDRISKAVEQLGAEKTTKGEGFAERTVPNIEVRIGGLLSLERISQDSVRHDQGRDHVRVMEIICAYVRANAPASEARDFPLPDWKPLADDASDQDKAAHIAWREARFRNRSNSNAREWAKSLPPPRQDIQQALTILGRRGTGQRAAEARWGTSDPTAIWPFDTPCPELDWPKDDAPLGKARIDAFKKELETWKTALSDYKNAKRYRLDLRGTNLQGADLSQAVLSGVTLNGARLEGADLQQARMEGANLGSARMEGANLQLARMEGADLTRARMEGAKLLHARMEGADLEDARMEGVDLRNAQMEGAELWSAQMEGAILWNARMERADLLGARMEGAVLQSARMEGADLTQARMEGAILTRARFDRSTVVSALSLRNAALSSVDLSMLDLSQAQVTESFGDASVTLPDRDAATGQPLTRPAHWPTWAAPHFLRTGQFYDEWHKWQADPDGYVPPLPPEDDAQP